MNSQTNRIFSQGGEMSQLTGPLSSQLNTNSDCTQREVDGLAHYSDNYNAVLNSQNEEPFSARVDAICEQNRQIRSFVEKNLKQIEKKRIKLTNKKSEIEDQIKIYTDKHKQQSQKSVELQMNIEETAEKYHNELNQRKNLIEKLKNTQIFVDYFMENSLEISKVTGDLEKFKDDLNLQFEKLYMILKERADEKSKLKLSFQSQMKEKINIAQKTKEIITKERETCSNTIQNLVMQNVEKGNTLNCIQEGIILLANKKTELKDSYNDLTLQNKSMKDGVVKLHKQLDELKTAHALNVQNLKLQINNEKNNNSNLEVKVGELKKSINVASTKENELNNLFSQMGGAVEQTTKRLEDENKKLQDYKDKKEMILNEIQTLEEDLTNCENAPNTNTFLKNEISRLEESNNINEQRLLERRDLLDKTSQEKCHLQETYNEIQANVQEMKQKLENSVSHQNELYSKLEQDRINHQLEREDKTLENDTLQEKNMDIADKLKNLNQDLEEAQITNSKTKTEVKNIQELIENYNKQKEESKKKLQINESEWEEICKAFKDSIDLKTNKLDELEESLIEARPYQEELAIISVRKETLKQDIQQQKEKYVKAMESLKNKFNLKITEISQESQKYTSIMEGINKANVEATEKLQLEIKKTDALRAHHESELRNFFHQINKLKKEEQMKRNKIEKLEDKLKAINQEIRITRRDISDAVAGNVKTSLKEKNITQTSSPNLLQTYQEPPQKKMAIRPNIPSNANFNEIKTKQWIESSHLQEDEYEFSDI